MANVKLVIFDCDGVLVDSELLACTVTARTMVDFGVHISVSDVLRDYTGISVEAMLRDLEKKYGVVFPETFPAVLRRKYLDAFSNSLLAMPGVDFALVNIQQRKCVASSSEPDRIRQSLLLTGLLHYFGENLFSAKQVACGKPAPDLFLFAAAKMGISPSESIVIEDSVSGVSAARAAEMKVLGFVGGAQYRSQGTRGILDVQGINTFADMRDLPNLINSFD